MTTPNVGSSYWTAALTQTAVQTANCTASPNQLVRVDTTSGNVTVTLPSAPPAGTVVGVKMVTLGGSNTVTVTTVAGDVFNKAGGGTTATLSLSGQGQLLEYQGGIWLVISDDLPLSQADSRYLKAASNLSDVASAGTSRANLGVAYDATAADFQPAGIAAAGSNGKVSDSGHAHPYVTAEPLTSGEAIFPRYAFTQQQALTASTVALTYWTACKTETINNVQTVTGSQGATLTYAAIGIYTIDGSGNLTLAASTGNLHSTLWLATDTEYTAALTSGFSKVAGTRYALGLLAVGATPPNLFGQYTQGSNVAPFLAATVSGTTMPATVSSGSLTTGTYEIAFQAVITP